MRRLHTIPNKGAVCSLPSPTIAAPARADGRDRLAGLVNASNAFALVNAWRSCITAYTSSTADDRSRRCSRARRLRLGEAHGGRTRDRPARAAHAADVHVPLAARAQQHQPMPLAARRRAAQEPRRARAATRARHRTGATAAKTVFGAGPSPLAVVLGDHFTS